MRDPVATAPDSDRLYALYAAINRQLVASEEVSSQKSVVRIQKSEFRIQKSEGGSLELRVWVCVFRVLVCGFCGRWRWKYRARNTEGTDGDTEI